MEGIITNRHLATNAPTIIREFGVQAYFRCVAACLFSRRQITFLETVMRLEGKRTGRYPLRAAHSRRRSASCRRQQQLSRQVSSA